MPAAVAEVEFLLLFVRLFFCKISKKSDMASIATRDKIFHDEFWKPIYF